MNTCAKQNDLLSNGLWGRIPRYIKLTFFSTFAIGLIVHMYVLTNKLPNHDDFILYNDLKWTFTSGRWFLSIVQTMGSGFSIPWLHGAFSLLFVSASACFIASCLHIHDSLSCLVLAVVMATFPTLITTFTYMLYADNFLFSMLLSCASVYFCNRFRRIGFPIAVVLLCLSLGTYQAYLSFATGISVGILIVEILSPGAQIKQVFFKALKLLAYIILAIVLYVIIVKYTTRNIPLTSYQNIDQIGTISIRQLLLSSIDAYLSLANFYFNLGLSGLGTTNIQSPLAVVATITALLCTLFFVCWAMFHRKKSLSWFHVLCFVLLIFLYPLAINSVILMNSSAVYLNMMYGMVLLLVLPLSLYNLLWLDTKSQRTSITQKVILGITLSSLLLVGYHYTLLANQEYLYQHQLYEQGYAYAIRLVGRMEDTEGYSSELPVVLVGRPAAEETHLKEFNHLKSISPGVVSIPTTYSFDMFLGKNVGLENASIYRSGDGIIDNFKPLVEAMPIYPADGSIQVLEGMLIVKLNNVP